MNTRAGQTAEIWIGALITRTGIVPSNKQMDDMLVAAFYFHGKYERMEQEAERKAHAINLEKEARAAEARSTGGTTT